MTEFSGAMTREDFKDDGVAELQDIRWLMNATAQRNWLYAQQSEDGGSKFSCVNIY
jgi:hypothetical protein